MKFSSGLDTDKQESSSSGTGGLSSVPLKVYSDSRLLWSIGRYDFVQIVIKF